MKVGTFTLIIRFEINGTTGASVDNYDFSNSFSFKGLL